MSAPTYGRRKTTVTVVLNRSAILTAVGAPEDAVGVPTREPAKITFEGTGTNTPIVTVTWEERS